MTINNHSRGVQVCGFPSSAQHNSSTEHKLHNSYNCSM